ncbi:hypothetical protein [Mongoliibacter sp.]|uniref:hypothetical protein n=1 Tax=Mongoliibacter sp. TaxID=2022438 RepID=UPI0025E1AA76|nr:hypothetical protein [Mongoliibacter sp.]
MILPLKNKFSFLTVYLMLFFASCINSDQLPKYQGEKIIVNTNLFDEDFLGSVTILEAEVRNEMLYLKVGYSGCSPTDDWTLVFSERFLYSQPPTLQAKLIFEPVTDCGAYFTSNLKFDLEKIRSFAAGPYHITLQGWGKKLQVP